jgi:hypothetical protein
MRQYAKTEEEVASIHGQLGRYFVKTSEILWRSLEDSSILDEITPRHGPGATAEHISGNQKWLFRTWHRRLSEAGFTYHRYGRGSRGGLLPCDDHVCAADEVRLLDPENEPPVRVVFVPKTLKTPRVIAVEPVCMQFAQQGLSRWLVRRLEKHPIVGSRINFRDQTINQRMAIEGSRDGRLATLDLSEASDRVSWVSVRGLLRSAPTLWKLVDACRTRTAELPDGTKMSLRKFASMGSALTFPIESMIFYTIIVASRIRRAGCFPTQASVEKYSADVYVFGDDLIVPADEAPAICADLEASGLKVNQRKSFWTGLFRESCGVDSYAGTPVTPVYLRQDCPADRTDASRIVACVATSNQLYSGGFYEASMTLRRAVERVLGSLPQVPSIVDRKAFNRNAPGSAAIGWLDYSESQPRRRFNRLLQRTEMYTWVVDVAKQDDPLEGYPALAKCWRLIGSNDPIDPGHLLRSVRPYSLTLKRRWVGVKP